MKKLTGPFLVVVIGIIFIIAVKILIPVWQDLTDRQSSDAVRTKGQATCGVDPFFGYIGVLSQTMKKELRRGGYIWYCKEVFDYGERFQMLDSGEIRFSVATVDSKLLNSYKLKFPGAIFLVIDQTKGADAVYANKKLFKGLDMVKQKVGLIDQLKGQKGLKVAFTALSPSEHLAKVLSQHFNAPELYPPKGPLRVETDSSEAALKLLESGKVDIAVIWEPECTRANKNTNLIRIIGTEDLDRVIVDILIANKKWAGDNKELVKLVTKTYFETMKKLRNNKDLFLDEARRIAKGLSDDDIMVMANGIRWYTFTENCKFWFDIPGTGQDTDYGLIDVIDSTVEILIANADLANNPLPNEDAARLIDRGFLKELYDSGFGGAASTQAKVVYEDSLSKDFSPLSDAQWARLKPFGTLKMPQIKFAPKSDTLEQGHMLILDDVAKRLKRFPNVRIEIGGHTGDKGDKERNLKLSKDRADSCAHYYNVTYGIDLDRMRVIGFGGTKPPKLNPREKDFSRKYRNRMPRVELTLLKDEI